MDWSFLTDGNLAKLIKTIKRNVLETLITAKYYCKTSETPERCEILNSQGQVFLHFRNEENPNAVGDCCTALKALVCCCFKQSMTGSRKSIASHPSFGDVINSQDMAIEFCCALCNFSSKIEEAFYSGGQLLGSFKIEKKGPCSGYEGFLIDAYSNPLMTSEINMESNTQVFK